MRINPWNVLQFGLKQFIRFSNTVQLFYQWHSSLSNAMTDIPANPAKSQNPATTHHTKRSRVWPMASAIEALETEGSVEEISNATAGVSNPAVRCTARGRKE
jgi:hypothetical protein